MGLLHIQLRVVSEGLRACGGGDRESGASEQRAEKGHEHGSSPGSAGLGARHWFTKKGWNRLKFVAAGSLRASWAMFPRGHLHALEHRAQTLKQCSGKVHAHLSSDLAPLLVAQVTGRGCPRRVQ